MGYSPDTLTSMGVEIFSDAAELARAAAEHFVTQVAEAIAERGRFAVALAGGSTPRATYTLLGSDQYARRVDWSGLHVFWGDERCVPPDHPDSNYRMARDAWLDKVPLPAGHVHRIPGELEPSLAAAEYERTLRTFFSPIGGGGEDDDQAPPRFDLILLGMGDDGHTASLFPGSAAIGERRRWVMAHYVGKIAAWRVTLTPGVINAAANVTFVVSGAGKAERLGQVLGGAYRPDHLPAQIVKPERGRLRWLVDSAAASLLNDLDSQNRYL